MVWAVFGLVLTMKVYLEWGPLMPGLTFMGFAPSQYLRSLFWVLTVPGVIYLQRRLPLSGPKRFQHLGAHFVISFAAMWLNWMIRYYVLSQWWLPGMKDFLLRSTAQFNYNNFVDMAIYWMILAGAAAAELYKRQRDLEVVQSQLQTQVAEAELHALKQQLQPHFLFNALNAVAMLVREKQEDRAVDTLAQLSALLRKLIDNTRQQEVVFASELDFTQRYLEIEKIRFGDRLSVRYDIPEDLLRALVPSLVLQPLVENAIKHGISRRIEPGQIRISAATVGDRMQIEVFNDPADDAAPESAPRVHLGLETTRERLRKTYSGDFELHCDFHPESGSRVRVSLPLHFALKEAALGKTFSP